MDNPVKKDTLEILRFSLLSFVSVKLITFLYVLAHNLIEKEQWSYWSVFPNFHIEKTWNMLFSPLIATPIFETLFFCSLLFKFCSKFRLPNYAFILFSAMLFATFHLLKDGAGIYTLAYTFIAGSIFAYFYNKQCTLSKSEDKAFILTSVVHVAYNLLVMYI